jgi:hypothetical protein
MIDGIHFKGGIFKTIIALTRLWISVIMTEGITHVNLTWNIMLISNQFIYKSVYLKYFLNGK